MAIEKLPEAALAEGRSNSEYRDWVPFLRELKIKDYGSMMGLNWFAFFPANMCLDLYCFLRAAKKALIMFPHSSGKTVCRTTVLGWRRLGLNKVKPRFGSGDPYTRAPS